MSAEQQIWKFLVTHGGYYCEECLARHLGLAVDEVRRARSTDLVNLYRMCHGCHGERRVMAVRPGAGLSSVSASIAMQR